MDLKQTGFFGKMTKPKKSLQLSWLQAREFFELPKSLLRSLSVPDTHPAYEFTFITHYAGTLVCSFTNDARLAKSNFCYAIKVF